MKVKELVAAGEDCGYQPHITLRMRGYAIRHGIKFPALSPVELVDWLDRNTDPYEGWADEHCPHFSTFRLAGS